ncbi:MAG: GIY-YIG nuclease family protein [Candidatus Pacebacteria bacterium]|nr:GIY-YIG nuclease family protein [Candidatus Paceibacterota bacterium]
MRSQGLKKLKLPDAPGVYFFKDAKARTLYIGRATSLRSRVRSYFRDDVISTRGSRIVDMVTRAKTVTFEKTDSVLEAIILEANLIKRYQPKYNTDEKDDKSWNYIVITDEGWPRVIVERGRNIEKSTKGEVPDTSFGGPLGEPSGRVLGMGNRGMVRRKNVSGAEAYKKKNIFGPYPAGGLLKDALKIIRHIFPYLDEKSLDPKHRTFYASIGLSPMLGDTTSHEEYLKTIKNIRLFLEGKKTMIIKNLKKDMMALAKNQEFEKADKVKHTIYALEHIEDVALIKDDRTNGVGGHGAFRIEAYDIAHLSGQNVVGVMTVVEGGEPNKSEYRKFKISKEKNDDAAALREVLLRRLGHPEWPYPSLIVVDGGQIQLNVAQKILSELKSDILAVALVKDDKHKARGIIAPDSITLKNPTLLAQYKRAIILANSEAHRFAISYHKNLRKRNFLK